MNDVDLQKHVEQIEQQLIAINKKTPGHLGAFGKGVLTGFGSLIGVALGLVILGYVLNAIGVIPAFRSEADSWKQILQRSQSYK